MGDTEDAVDEQIKVFWNKHEEQKKKFYWEVQRFGLFLLLFGFFVTFASSLSFDANGFSSLIWAVFFTLGNFVRTVGNCIYSVVPVKELDMVLQLLLAKNNSSRKILSLSIVLVSFIISFFNFLAVFNDKAFYNLLSAITSLCLCLFLIPNLFTCPSYDRLSIQFQAACFTIAAGFTSYNFTYFYSWEANFYLRLLPFFPWCFAGLFICFVAYEGMNVPGRREIKSPLSDDDLRKINKESLKSRNFSNAAGEFNACLYCISIIGGGINMLILGSMQYRLGYSKVYYYNNFIGGCLDLLPIFVILWFGSDKCFWFVAYFYENGRSKLIEEGAFMAELISKCGNKIDEYRWIQRKNERTGYYYYDKETSSIQRSFWMKAKVMKRDNLTLTLQLDYNEDVRPKIEYHYQSNVKPPTDAVIVGEGPQRSIEEGHHYPCDVILIEGVSQVVMSEFSSPPNEKRDDTVSLMINDFQSWESAFVDYSKVERVSDNISEGKILIQEIIKDKSFSKDELIEYAHDNLRVFDMKDFTDDILRTSPRELKTDEDKEKAYNLSKPLTNYCYSSTWAEWMYSLYSSKDGTKQRGIDYFVSHSWEDPYHLKCSELKKFSADFQQRHRRTPRLWLDKICIDQKDSSLGLAVLPININYCDKFLILLSRTYLRRLWCIWELFTLFCFVSKESVVFDRIDFVILAGDSFTMEDMIKELENFNINNAVCFGPNEEFQLRLIIMKFDPTGEKMINCFKELASLLRKKKQGTLFQRTFIKCSQAFNNSLVYKEDKNIQRSKSARVTPA